MGSGSCSHPPNQCHRHRQWQALGRSARVRRRQPQPGREPSGAGSRRTGNMNAASAARRSLKRATSPGTIRSTRASGPSHACCADPSPCTHTGWRGHNATESSSYSVKFRPSEFPRGRTISSSWCPCALANPRRGPNTSSPLGTSTSPAGGRRLGRPRPSTHTASGACCECASVG